MAILKRLLAVLVAVLLIAVPATLAQGAPGGGPGKPPGAGNGGGGNGGGGNGGGKANPGNKLGDLYADLMVLARYADGTPITVTHGDETCLQPITPTPVGDLVNGSGVYPYEQDMYYIPLVGDQMAVMAEEEDEDELEPCDVQAEYADLVEEVDLGRLNLGRAPERVLTKQLRDVQVFLTSGDIGLDASGRFTRSIDDVVVQTLDSPLANLAAYQSILETGRIGTIGIPNLEPDFDLSFWELTAAQFGAAAPKDAFTITVDTVQYLNRILGIPLQQDWDGVTTIGSETGEVFVSFAGFAYDRDETFPGCARYRVLNDDGTWYDETKALTEVVPFTGTGQGSGVDGYAKFAEDARKVLVWTHDAELLLEVDFITHNEVCPTQ